MSERLPLSLSIEFSLLVETIVDSSCYYKWHSADFDAITCYLAHVDWYELIYNFPSVYDMWVTLIRTVYLAVNLYVSVKFSRKYKSQQKSTAVFIPKTFVMLLLQNVAAGVNIKLKEIITCANYSIRTWPDTFSNVCKGL